jgi:2OG-Fe(II) oxygenase superfamily
MALLDFAALSRADIRVPSKTWAVVQPTFLSPDTALDLAGTFPTEGFEWHVQHQMLAALGKLDSEQGRRHRVRTRPLIERGADQLSDDDDLADEWRELGKELLAPDYRRVLSELSRIDLTGEMQTHFWRYEDGSSFVPHIDKAHKVVTHLIYLSEAWEPAEGGCLRILGSDSIDDVLDEIPPRLGDSVILVNRPGCWHAVTPVVAPDSSRKVLQSWFWG